MKTVLETIASGAGFLEKKGVESPRLNMEHLLAHVLNCKRMQLYMWFDRPLGEAELEPLRELTKKRGSGVPLQHLLGTVEFHRHTFKCDGRALIPRPETEELVDKLVKRLKATPPARLLDVGTGSGCLGLSLAASFAASQATLVDVSRDALALARENAEAIGILDRVSLTESDLFSALPGEKYDLIVANLPYIPHQEIATLSREVQCDPHLALDGGPAGTEIMDRFIAALPAYLAPDGLVAMEYGLDQAGPLSASLRRAGFQQIEVALDFTDRERFLFAKMEAAPAPAEAEPA